MRRKSARYIGIAFMKYQTVIAYDSFQQLGLYNLTDGRTANQNDHVLIDGKHWWS